MPRDTPFDKLGDSSRSGHAESPRRAGCRTSVPAGFSSPTRVWRTRCTDHLGWIEPAQGDAHDEGMPPPTLAIAAHPARCLALLGVVVVLTGVAAPATAV